MKKISFIALSLFIISIFFICGCNKDDYYYSKVYPVASVEKDSLVGRAWLQNMERDTVRIFKEGEVIIVGISVQNLRKTIVNTSFDLISSKIYRSNDSRFMGYPLFYPKEYLFTVWQLPSMETGSDYYFIDNGKMEDNKKLPTGEYYINIGFETRLYNIDTLSHPKWDLKGSVTFSDLKINFKIR